jgi:hypothetical protein
LRVSLRAAQLRLLIGRRTTPAHVAAGGRELDESEWELAIAKYQVMLGLRTLPYAKPDAQRMMRTLAVVYPTSLRELDGLPLDQLKRRKIMCMAQRMSAASEREQESQWLRFLLRGQRALSNKRAPYLQLAYPTNERLREPLARSETTRAFWQRTCAAADLPWRAWQAWAFGRTPT